MLGERSVYSQSCLIYLLCDFSFMQWEKSVCFDEMDTFGVIMRCCFEVKRYILHASEG